MVRMVVVVGYCGVVIVIVRTKIIISISRCTMRDTGRVYGGAVNLLLLYIL